MRLYFAYGSNLCSDRLRARVGEFGVAGAARLDDWRHRFTKHGSDGTGKGNIVPEKGAHVRGALYSLRAPQFDILDGYEGGYERALIEVVGPAGVVRATTYVGLVVAEGLPVKPGYLKWYRRGVAEHSLGEDYLEGLLAELGVGPSPG